MTNCRRNERFTKGEKHACFVLGCTSDCEPGDSPTCPVCNFKKCGNGHCACNVSPETKKFLDAFYATFCDHKENEELEHAKKIMVETWYFNCCLPQHDQVVWIHHGRRIHWKPMRTPALAWNEPTVLEALVDSAKTSLHMGYPKTTLDRLNKALQMLRAIIKREKKHNTLIPRCEHRETQKTRCNRYECVLHDKEEEKV